MLRRLVPAIRVLCVALAPTISTATAATSQLPTMKPGMLTVGTYFVNPPFEYVADGQRVGFEVDLMSEVARRLGLRADFVDTVWEKILGQMQAGTYDCIIGGITITPRRAAILTWSQPYLTTTLSLIVDARRTPGIHGFADLGDATLAVQAATTDEDAAEALLKAHRIAKVAVYPFARIADALTDLEAGRVEAVMKVAPVAEWFVRRHPDLRIVAQVAHDPQRLGIGFKKGSRALPAAVDAALTAIRGDGTFARLARKWDVP